MGTLALVGAGEFLDPMKAVDIKLLEMASGSRVVVLPTASAPDGPGVPERWARMGVDHFNALGAQVQAVMALDRAGCSDAANVDRVRDANLVYFSGGKPDYLIKTLRDTPLWQAVRDVLDRGGVIAGCSAGAMIMGSFVPSFSLRALIPGINGWNPGFGLVPGAVIMPHYDEFPEVISTGVAGQMPDATFLIGIDGNTALVGTKGNWVVMGAHHVTLKKGKQIERYTTGQTVPVDE